MKKFEMPKIEVCCMEAADVITASTDLTPETPED